MVLFILCSVSPCARAVSKKTYFPNSLSLTCPFTADAFAIDATSTFLQFKRHVLASVSTANASVVRSVHALLGSKANGESAASAASTALALGDAPEAAVACYQVFEAPSDYNASQVRFKNAFQRCSLR